MTTRTQSLASPGNAWPAGHRLGPFELLEVVSSRSGAIVYRGWDHALQRPVAIKEYLPARLARRNTLGGVQPAGADEAVAFELGRRAFVEEARQLARCDHPALLRVLALLELHGTAYRVMPWLAGTPLSTLRDGMAGPPDETALRRLADELLGALETWHAAVGQPHGGVEPAQVLLLEDDRALLLGPGLARRSTANDAVESLMRQLEPAWAAPELRAEPSASRPPGPWSDFHALALTLRYALTGQPPPPAGAPRPAPLASTIERLFAEDASARYDDRLLQALEAAAAADPRARPQTAQAFRELLAGLAAPAPLPPIEPVAVEAEAPPAPAPADDRDAPVVAPPVAALDVAPPALPMADDETTARLIRSVIAAIPDAPVRSVPAPADAAPARPVDEPAAADPLAAAAADAAPVWSAPEAAATGRPRRRWLPAMLAVLVVAGGAGAAWWAAQGPAPLPTAPSTAPAIAAVPAPEPAPSPTPSPAPEPTPAPAPSAEAAPPPPAPVEPPVAAVPPPAAPRAAGPSSPRELCGPRSDFALYRCFQQQCAKAAWARHPQCLSFKRTDEVPG